MNYLEKIMSGYISLECKYCGNTDRSRFVLRAGEYVCRCCGRCYRETPTGGEMRATLGFETLKNYDFEGAENIFSDIISEYPESVDARWGLLLARYGIVFVKGFYMGEIEPIYCFPNYAYSKGSFTSEKEYKEIEKLLANDSGALAVYKEQAAQIERAFASFKSDFGKKENDVFICVKISKTTASNPELKGTTVDYEKACELYGKLREEGKNVFFSYVTLKNTIDSDMEIWRNMIKSKKMLLIGSRTEYMNSVWVKSEWERWIWMDGAGSDEHKKNLYIYILGNENENLYAKLPAGLKRLHPQIYTESTEADLLNDICHGDEPAPEVSSTAATTTKKVKPVAAKPVKAEKPAKSAEEENKDGYVIFLNGSREAIPYGTTKVNDYSGRNDVSKVSLPATVTEIGKSNFSDCPNLTKIHIPASVTKIGKGAFSGCAKLTSIEIPSGISEIEPNTFYMCKRLASVKLHDGVTKIGDLAFAQCESLKGIALPHSLMTIGTEAFHSSGLKSVTLPKAVVSVGERAFGVCGALEKVKIYDNVTSIGNGAFDNKANLQITYSGTQNEFASIYKSYSPPSKYSTYNRSFTLICEREPAVIAHRIWVGGNVLALLAMIIGAVVFGMTVPGGIHWAISVPVSIAANMIIAIITRYHGDTDEGMQFVVNIIELVACVVLLPCAFITTNMLIYMIALAAGMLIATIYIKITEDSMTFWIFICFQAAMLLIPIAILTWSLLGLAIPLLLAAIVAIICGFVNLSEY